MDSLLHRLSGYYSWLCHCQREGHSAFKIVEQLAYIPYVIPGIAFGAVYIAMFESCGPIPALYGTFALLVIVSVAKHIPYSSRSGVSAMMQVGRELEEAAQVAGANVWQRFRRIIFPLTSSGFVSGFLLTFITTMRELSLIILLVTPQPRCLPARPCSISKMEMVRWQTS